MMNKQNPFTHTFGKEPVQYISTLQTEEIIENFSYPDPSEKCYMITGVRDCTFLTRAFQV